MPEKTEAQKKAQKKYMEKFMVAQVRMEREKYERVQAHAEAQGESVNGFINRAIDHQISQDRDKGPSEAQQGPSWGGGISLHQEALQTAQNAAQKAGETVSQFVERAVETQAQRDETSLKLGINPSAGGKLEKKEA